MKFTNEIKNGEIILIEGQPYRVISVVKHAGAAKMSGVVHLKLKNLKTLSETDKRFRPDEKIEDVTLEKRNMEYIYAEGDNYYFMDQTTYEQIPITGKILGPIVKFLQPNITLPVEFFNGEPINVIFPETITLKVKTTGSGVKGDSDVVWKSAILENDMEINVPPFIEVGDTVKINVYTGEYIERVKEKS
ncbi:MAG: elongation factor P [bacterium]